MRNRGQVTSSTKTTRVRVSAFKASGMKSPDRDLGAALPIPVLHVGKYGVIFAPPQSLSRPSLSFVIHNCAHRLRFRGILRQRSGPNTIPESGRTEELI